MATPQVTVTAAPTSVGLAPFESRTLQATVANAVDTSVTWSVLEAGGGTVDAQGKYTAPVGAGTYHVVATSVADATKSATVTVTVSTGPTVTVKVMPSSATLPPDGTKKFDAAVFNAPTQGVLWSATCGTVDAAGNYKAPAAAATCTVTATSVADATKSASATVTVTSTVAVVVAPTPTVVAKGASKTFTATVTGAANTGVTWSLTGPLGAGSIDATGTFSTLGATATTPYTVTVKAVSQADGVTFATATVDVVTSALRSVSGTVTYGGAKQGRIYIDVLDTNDQVVGGTSIAAPGPFTARCLSGGPSNYRILAWRDVKGVLKPLFATDPWVKTGTFAYDGLNDVTGVAVALADPSPTIPTKAPGIQGTPAHADGASVVVYSPVLDGAGRDVADHYNLYVSTTPNPGPTNQIMTRRSSGASYGILAAPLVNGQAYYFAVSAVNAAGEGPKTTVGPITIGPATGGHTVKGAVDLGGTTPTGPLYVYVSRNADDTLYVTYVPNPAAVQSFQIDGVPDGTISVGAVLDQAGDGEIGLFDPQVRRPIPMPVAADVTLPLLTLPASDVVSVIRTKHEVDFGGGNERFDVEAGLYPVRRVPATATLVTGAGLGANVPWDLGVSLDARESGHFELRWLKLAATPAVDAPYTFDVSFVDGGAGTSVGKVTGIVGPPTALTPGSTGVGTTPSFSWQAPVPPPASARYSMAVGPPNLTGGTFWELSDLPAPPAVPIVYNFDGKATPLTVGVEAEWWVYVADGDDNLGVTHRRFTP